jgi:hypothetical protein
MPTSLVALALTVIVPETVDPEVGDVMFTTGGCAAAEGGKIQPPPKITNSATAYIRLIVLALVFIVFSSLLS